MSRIETAAVATAPPPPPPGLRRACGMLWPALLATLRGPVFWLGALTCLAAAWAGTALLSPLLGPPASPELPGPALIATSFLLNLGLLGALLATLPANPSQPWGYLGAWVRFLLWALAAGCGLKAAARGGSAGQLDWVTVMTLVLITASHGAALCASARILELFAGRYRHAARATVLLGLALLAGGLFWSRRPLMSLAQYDYQRYCAAPEELQFKWAEKGTQALLELGPPLALASAWHHAGSSFDLIKGPLTYRVWVGSWVFPYPCLWPPRWTAATPRLAAEAPREAGLILTLLSWGLLTLAGADLLALASGPRRGPS